MYKEALVYSPIQPLGEYIEPFSVIPGDPTWPRLVFYTTQEDVKREGNTKFKTRVLVPTGKSVMHSHRSWLNVIESIKLNGMRIEEVGWTSQRCKILDYE